MTKAAMVPRGTNIIVMYRRRIASSLNRSASIRSLLAKFFKNSDNFPKPVQWVKLVLLLTDFD
ncbi:MAG: hypothetical protein QF443_04945 [Dehalococcoidia bacterium]|nr:hypothetical protein [Dehalococcoidia bacterium]